MRYARTHELPTPNSQLPRFASGCLGNWKPGVGSYVGRAFTARLPQKLKRNANCTWRGVPRTAVRPTVLVRRPNVPAAAAVYGCPGWTRLASVRVAPGNAFGSVPTGFEKFVMLNRLKISVRNSTFGPLPTLTCLAMTRSVCLKLGP